MNRRKASIKTVARWLALLALVIGLVPGVPLPAGAASSSAVQAQEATYPITLNVVSARTESEFNGGAGVLKGAAVTDYKFLISVDNTGDSSQPYKPDCYPYQVDPATLEDILVNGAPIRNPNYPDSCNWPGIREVPGWAPVYTQGTAADAAGIQLPVGKYLVSVEADGYKVDGEHFTIPDDDGVVTVQVHPEPLPTASMTIKVFNDNAMTNGQWDGAQEVGLAGFRASINDVLGEVTTDMFGNPLCTEYDAAGNVTKLGNGCYSDNTGTITIPNIGTIRWDVLVIPPDGTNWVQTTTLEGSQGWDTWLQEGATGMDNEFMVAGEPFPWTIFGFVQPNTAGLSGTGTITGVIMGSITASPTAGGLPYQGTIWGGWSGTKLHRPIPGAWIALSDFQNGDATVWVGQADANGAFVIPNVPAGNYFLAYWDEKQHYILDWTQLTVTDGGTTDLGVRTMTGWFTEFYGTVFNDENRNGKRDEGEPGIPNYLVVLKDRDNTEIDRMSIASTTDGAGFYEFEKAYPMGSWMILEAYSDLYRTTGITYQVWNQAEETTILGNGVDVAVLPVLGQPARLDWGVTFYDPGTNGGIVGTVFYDTMRAEDNAAYAGAEPYQPGIPDLQVQLYKAAKDPVTGELLRNADGSIQKMADEFGTPLLLMEATTEKFVQPVNCQARDVDGNPVDIPVLPPYEPGATAATAKRCLEGPVMGTQIGSWPDDTGALSFGAALDGNYGLTEGCFADDGDPATPLAPGSFDPMTGACTTGELAPLPPADYLVEVVIPNDPVLGRPLFQVTREEDVNMYNGDEFIPAVAPPACAGPLHTVDIKGIDQNGVLQGEPGFLGDGPDAVVNPGYVDAGGSRFEGQAMPLCNVKLVTVGNGKSIAPLFQLFTDVPIPGKWKGYIINDLMVSVNPKELFFGEMAGVANSPIGIYDFTNRLVHTVTSDLHGVYEVLLPSSGTTNAPTPSGLLASVYYIYGNDPGQPGNLNANYNPQFRSIGTAFEIYPGVIVPSDLAPVRNGAGILAPGSQFAQQALCKLEPTTPQIFAVSQPYVNPGGTFTIYGQGFGSPPGPAPTVRLDNVGLQVLSGWSDTEMTVRLNNNTQGRNLAGPRQLSVRRGAQSTVNGLTIHVLYGAYNPTLYEVGPGRTYDSTGWDGSTAGPGPIQRAVDATVAAGGPSLIVVYPGDPTPFNPTGGYFENVVLHGPVKLQGVGPGGQRDADGVSVPGTYLDGRAVGGDSAYGLWWTTWVFGNLWAGGAGWDGTLTDGDGLPILSEGAVITVLAKAGEFAGQGARVDGFTIEGGDQQGFPTNINLIGGGTIPGVPAVVTVQGGGIYLNAHADGFQISNNIIRSNGGAYAGAIRVGTPHVAAPNNDHHNHNIKILNNRILGNGGANLAGAIGLFNDSDGYEVARNDICGNYTIEYGGGISHYGLSPNSSIHHNRIYFNSANDEGGGVMIAGELPADPAVLSTGAGPVDVYNNLIQANLSNDDGGGLRFLMSGNFRYRVFNNMIVNNVSTHEGGGVSIFDAPNVWVYSNTIMKNLTTATAMTSNGQAAPAGLSTVRNSNLLQATLPAGSPAFSNPILFNNIFWDNRAGSRTLQGVSGIGMPGDPNPINPWDLGVADGTGTLNPGYSLLQTPYGEVDTNIDGLNPLVISEYDVAISIMPWRGNTNFIGTSLVAVELPPSLMGDYHIQTGSPARNSGTTLWMTVPAPTTDYDDQNRPSSVDIGADER